MIPILAMLVGLGSLVCWIMVVIKIFQAGNVGLGILGIFCPLFTFIYGWIKADEFGIKNLMLIWTVLVIAGIGLNLAMPRTAMTVHTSS